MSVIVDYDRQFTGTVSACGSTMGNGNVIRPDLVPPIQTPASEDSGRCRHWVTFRWPCFVLEGDDLVAPFQASWPAASEPSEGLLGQASTLARERCLAGLAPAAVVDMPVQLRPRHDQQPGDLPGKQVSIREAPAGAPRGLRPRDCITAWPVARLSRRRSALGSAPRVLAARIGGRRTSHRRRWRNRTSTSGAWR